MIRVVRFFAPMLLLVSVSSCAAALKHQQECKKQSEDSMRVPHAPPHHGFAGVWHCRYQGDGAPVSERVTFAVSPDGRATMSGGDNYGGNLVGDGFAGGTEIAIRLDPTHSRKLRMVSSSMLDGSLFFDQCGQSRLTCTR